MGIRFILMVNKKGQTRLAQCYEYPTIEERRALEGEIVRKCLARTELQNELAILKFIHLVIETMDCHFGNVCELDMMFHLEKAHFMLEEMVMNGCIVETSKSSILDSDTADGQRLVTIFTSTLQRCQKIYLSLPTVPTHN